MAVATLIAASAIQLGLNVANDVFDTASGADAANLTPTPFSGGSRVIVYGLLSARQMTVLAAACYAVGLGIGLALAIARGFWPLFWIGASRFWRMNCASLLRSPFGIFERGERGRIGRGPLAGGFPSPCLLRQYLLWQRWIVQ